MGGSLLSLLRAIRAPIPVGSPSIRALPILRRSRHVLMYKSRRVTRERASRSGNSPQITLINSRANCHGEKEGTLSLSAPQVDARCVALLIWSLGMSIPRLCDFRWLSPLQSRTTTKRIYRRSARSVRGPLLSREGRPRVSPMKTRNIVIAI